MRATKLLCCCALALCALPLTAQTRPPAGPSTPQSGLAALRAPDSPLVEEALASRFLFFALTPELVAPSPQFLEFRIGVNGEPFLEEMLDLRQVAGAQSAAFEILSTRPGLRERLYELGRDRANRVSLQVVVDGAVVREFGSFAELLRYNRGIKRSLNAAAAPSEVRDLTGAEAPAASPDPLARLFAKGVQPDPECLQNCQYEYDECTWWGCDYGDCSRCQAYYDDCVRYCPTVCIDPKSVQNTNHSQFVGVLWYGYSECLEHWWENDYQWGEWYQWLQLQYKTYTLRRTEYCDGTVTYEELNVQYPTVYCANRTYSSCYQPFSKAWNAC